MLEIRNASMPAASQFAVTLKDINLSVKAGEILGIAGVAGNGQSELFQLISGEVSHGPDNIMIRGKQVGALSINERRKMGASFVPEERLGHGAVPDFSLSQNMLLSRHKSDDVAFQRLKPFGVIRANAVNDATKRVCKAMDVRKSTEDPLAGSLSGGNLQKFIMGRELDRQPSILVINQPTWGVDAGAAQRIRQAVIDLARSGTAVLVISQDLDEISEIADRVAVMSHGRLIDAGEMANVTREHIGLLMGGSGAGQAGAHAH